MTERRGASEAERARRAYERRARLGLDGRYSLSDPANLYTIQRREAELLLLLRQHGVPSLAGLRVLDAGCGNGSLLRDLVRHGAAPASLAGVDFDRDRVGRALELSPEMGVVVGDATRLPFADGEFDLALAFTILSSVVDAMARERCAAEILRTLRPGGLLIVYDFWVNPFNRDVRPLRASELRRLFGGHLLEVRRVTLAPPIVRRLARASFAACRLLEAVPLLRTHHLAAIRK